MDESNAITASPAGHASLRSRWRGALSLLTVRITLAAVVALVVGIGVTTAVLTQLAARDTLVGQQERELRATARTAKTLLYRLQDLQRMLNSAATQLGPEALRDRTKVADFLRNQPVLLQFFTDVFVVDANGKLMAAMDLHGLRSTPADIADREYFRQTLALRRPVVSGVLPSRVTGEPVVVFTQPLQGPGGFHGVLGGVLGLSHGELDSGISEAPTPQARAQLLVVVSDAQGRLLVHPDAQRLLQPVSSEPRLAQAFAAREAQGRPNPSSGLQLPQDEVMVSAAGVDGVDWTVWRAIPKDRLLQPLQAARMQALYWAAGLIVAMSLAMLFLLRWLLRPLARLEQRSQALFDPSVDPQAGWPGVGGEIGRLSAVLRRVGTERARLEAANVASLARLHSVMAAAPLGIAFSRDGRFELVSTELCQLFARSEAELLGAPVQAIFASNADHQAFVPQCELVFQSGGSYVGEWRMLKSDGTLFWARLRGRLVDARHQAEGVIWTLNDIDDQVAARAQLEWSATHDTLTGLANRTVWEERIGRLFRSMPRSIPAAIVVIDLDHFKPINDSAGHAAGDAVLKAVAAAIGSRIRVSDLAVRLGGDEFGLLLERCTHDVALRVAENVRVAIADILLPWERRTLRVGASVGVSSLHAGMESPQSWTAEADVACYRAKADGRGVVRAEGLHVIDNRRLSGE